MEMDWIERVLRMNTHIVAAEDRFADLVTDLVTMGAQGQDTAELELQLASHQRRIVLMREVQAQQLHGLKAKT